MRMSACLMNPSSSNKASVHLGVAGGFFFIVGGPPDFLPPPCFFFHAICCICARGRKSLGRVVLYDG